MNIPIVVSVLEWMIEMLLAFHDRFSVHPIVSNFRVLEFLIGLFGG